MVNPAFRYLCVLNGRMASAHAGFCLKLDAELWCQRESSLSRQYRVVDTHPTEPHVMGITA